MSGYESFRDAIEGVLRASDEPLTWGQVREKAQLLQKLPNNKWVRRLEDEIGLIRKTSRDGTVRWRLRKGANNARD